MKKLSSPKKILKACTFEFKYKFPTPQTYYVRTLMDTEGFVYIKATDFMWACGYGGYTNNKMFEQMRSEYKRLISYKSIKKSDKLTLDDNGYYFYGKGSLYLTWVGAYEFYDKSDRYKDPAQYVLIRTGEKEGVFDEYGKFFTRIVVG